MADPTHGISGFHVYFWDDVDCGDTIGWNRWKPRSPGNADWFIPERLSGSYYSGGYVNRANYEAFREKWEDEGCFVWIVGGHQTYGVAIALIDEVPEEVWEELQRLENDLVLDEDKLTELELEGDDESWKAWGAREFQYHLEKELEDAYGSKYAEDALEQLDFASEDVLRELFERCASSANEYWESDGDQQSRTINVKRIVSHCVGEMREGEGPLWWAIEQGHLSAPAEPFRDDEPRERAQDTPDYERASVEDIMELLNVGRSDAESIAAWLSDPKKLEMIAQTPAGRLREPAIRALQIYWGYPDDPLPRYRPEVPPAAQRPKFDWAAMTEEQRDYWRSLGHEPPTKEQLHRRIVDYRRRGLVEGYHYNPRVPAAVQQVHRLFPEGDAPEHGWGGNWSIGMWDARMPLAKARDVLTDDGWRQFAKDPRWGSFAMRKKGIVIQVESSGSGTVSRLTIDVTPGKTTSRKP